MGEPIYFSPEYLMGDIFGGIGDGNVEIRNLSKEQFGAQIELSFRTKDGSFRLKGCGQYKENCTEAMRSALFVVLEKLRRRHGILIGDFHFVMIMNNYNQFKELRVRMDHFRSIFFEINEEAKKYLACVNSVSDEISKNLSVSNEVAAKRRDNCLREYHECLTSYASSWEIEFDEGYEHVVQTVRDEESQGELRSFEKSNCSSMEFDRKASCFIIKRLFEEAIKKMEGCVGIIDVSECQNGSFVAKFSVTTESLVFYSNEMSNETEAKVCCMIKTLKYIEESGRYEIIDLYYPIWKSMLFEIENFDAKINMILSYGLYLESAIESGFDQFRDKMVAMVNVIEEEEGLKRLCEHICSAVEEITVVKERILSLSSNLQNSKVSRIEVEAGIQDG